jgi:hypothetical protein
MSLLLENATPTGAVCFTSDNGVSNRCAAFLLHTHTHTNTHNITHFYRLLWKEAQTWSTVSSDTEGRPDSCLLKCKASFYLNVFQQTLMGTWLGDFMSDCVWNACCTAVTDSFSIPAEHTNSLYQG